MAGSGKQESLVVSLLLLGSKPIPCTVTNVNQSGIELRLNGTPEITADLLHHSCRPGAAAAVWVTRPGEESWQVPTVFLQQNQLDLSLRYSGAPPPEANRLARLFSEVRAGNVNVAATLDALESCVSEQTRRIYEDFLAHVDETLFLLAKDSLHTQEQNEWLGIRNQIRARQKQMTETYCSTIKGQIRHLKREDNVRMTDSMRTLSLMDKEALDDALDAQEIMNGLYEKHCADIEQIKQRFESLVSIKISEEVLPVGPEYLCEAFRASLGAVEINGKKLHQIYALYSDALNDRTADLYEEFGRVLIEAGVLPDLEISHRQAMQLRQKRLEIVSSQTSLPKVEIDALMDALEKVEVEEEPGSRYNSPEHLYQTVRTLMSINKRTEQVQRAQFGAHAPSGDELLDILSTLEKQADFSKLETQNGGIKEAINEYLLEGSDNKMLSLSHDDSIELFEDMFNSILNGNEVDEAFKIKILRLKTPLLKRVIMDESFFSSRKHPARTLFNQITQLGGYASVLGTKALRQTDEIIDTVVRLSPFDNQSLFQLSSQAQLLLDRQQELRTRQISRVVDIHAGREKLARANHEVDSTIVRYATEEKTLPMVVCNLLNAGLRQYLLLTWINHGIQSDAWRRSVGDLRSLLGWLQGCEDKALLMEQLKMVDSQQALEAINHLDECIESVSSGVQEHKPYLTVLATVLLDRQYHVNSLAQAPLTVIQGYSDPESNGGEIDSKDGRLLKLFEVNDWIKLPESPPREALQLVWTSYDHKYYLLADRGGHEHARLSAKEMAAKIREGWQIEKGEENSGAVDRGIYTTLQHVYQQLSYQRCHDELTGLINRREFERLAGQLMQSPTELADGCYILVLDIDQFGLINSLCGHHIGDELLMDVAEILRRNLPDTQFIARIGSNEFAAIIKNHDEMASREITETIRQDILGYAFGVGGRPYQVTASFGLAQIDSSVFSLASVLRRAGSACSLAKEMGRNRIMVYKEDDNILRQRKKLEEWYPRINEAISDNSLYLKVQKIAPNMDDMELPHYEVLLGLNDAENKPIPIWQFIQAAEHFRKMEDVDRWVINAVFNWINANPEKMKQMDCISINLSGATLGNEDFLEYLLEKITTLELEPHRLCFEITETAAIQNIDKAISFITELRNNGCLFSLDDFGTGFSSYEYLKKLPVDYLKIDGVFIKNLTASSDDLAVVKSICEIGHYMNKKIVAEFVETNDIRDLLKTVGVDYVQGYGVEMPKEIIHL